MISRAYKDDGGQVLALTAFSLVILLAIMGTALDAGILFRAKRNIQIAADAAAVAGALDYKYNGSVESAVAAGQQAAAQNGATNGSNGVVVSINVPPKYGPYAGTSGFVEAIIQDPMNTLFMGMFGFRTVNLSGRAVVAAGASATSACVWTLDKSGKTISLNGSAALYTPNCSIFDNSNASNALTLTGSATISAKSIGIVGGYSASNNGSLTPTPVTGMAPTSDPLAGMSAPTIPSDTCSGTDCNVSLSGSSNLTLSPGTYSSISNSGSGTITLSPGNYIITGDVSNSGPGTIDFGQGNYYVGGNFSDTASASIIMNPGLYTIGGTLKLTGSGTIQGTNVTFYTQGSTDIAGGSNLSLTAPTSGTYNGVLFFQARNNSQSLGISGSSASTVEGIIYAPAGAVTVSGNSGMTVSLDIISDSLAISGTGTITDTNYASATDSNSLLEKTVMVE